MTKHLYHCGLEQYVFLAKKMEKKNSYTVYNFLKPYLQIQDAKEEDTRASWLSVYFEDKFCVASLVSL